MGLAAVLCTIGAGVLLHLHQPQPAGGRREGRQPLPGPRAAQPPGGVPGGLGADTAAADRGQGGRGHTQDGGQVNQQHHSYWQQAFTQNSYNQVPSFGCPHEEIDI